MPFMPAEPPADHKFASSGLSHARRVLEVAGVFVRLGFTAFGGPAAHVAMMEQEVVVRRRWLDRREFLDAYAAINFIPGPNSTELAIYLGSVRAGFAGLLTAGFCFILPAMLIILPIAWAYVRYGQIAQVRGMMIGVNAAVVAIVAGACVRFAGTSIRDGFEKSVAAGALIGAAAMIHFRVSQPDLIVLGAAVIAGVIRHAASHGKFPTGGMPLLAVPLPAIAAGAAPLAAPATGSLLQLAGLFLKIGATLFGSGYVLVSYLQNSVVDQYHWMTSDQLSSAVSVGQFTPGPLLTTATFIGYCRGWQLFGTIWGGVAGAVIATASIFAPAFILIALLGRFLPRLRKSPLARAALNAVSAAVVSLIAIAAVRLGIAALVLPGSRAALPIAVFLISLLALIRYNVNATWTIILGAVVGLVTRL
jgi:chromate transporter